MSERLPPSSEQPTRPAEGPSPHLPATGRSWPPPQGPMYLLASPDGERRPRLTLVGKVVTGLVTTAAALVGIYVAFRPSAPPGPPLSRWVTDAAAVCDETHGDVRSKGRKISAEIDRVMQALGSGQVTTAQLAAVATRAEDYADAERLVLAGLRRLPTPQDGSAEVDGILRDGDDIVRGFDRFATDIREVDPGDPADLPHLQDALTAVRNAMEGVSGWNQRMQELDVTSCLLS